jgi:ribonuclease E
VRKKKVVEAPAEAAVAAPAPEAPVEEAAPAKPKRVRKKKVVEAPAEAAPAPKPRLRKQPCSGPADAGEDAAAEGDDNTAPRRGWWQRTFGA